MKAALKYFIFIILILAVFSYIYFLKFLPDVIDINKYKPQIQKALKDNSGLNLDFETAKFVTTPALGVGIIAKEANITLSDSSRFLKIPCVKIVLSLPELLLLNIKVSDISVYKPLLNIEIANNKEIKAVKSVENFLYEKEKNRNIYVNAADDDFNPVSLFRINLPKINIYDYRAYVIDNQTKDYLLLRGDKLSLAYNNSKRFKLKTNSKLFLNKNENINLNIDIDSYIPEKSEFDEEDDPEVRREMPFINLVSAYKKYNLKTDISAKLKIDKNDIRGFLDVQSLTLNLGKYQIPESSFNFLSKRHNYFINTNLALQNNQNFYLKGRFNKNKKTDFDLILKSDGIYLDNFLSLLTGITDSIGLKTEIPYFKGSGHFIADAEINMRPKKLKSKGKITFKNGAVINKKVNLGLSDINLALILDDNTLKIQDSGLKINDGIIKAQGSINKKSDTDLSINANKIPCPVLFNLFANDELKKNINFKNGTITFDGILKGKLSKAEYEFDLLAEKLSLADKKETVLINNDSFEVNVQKNKNFYGVILNNGFKMYLPYTNSNVSNNLIKISFDDNDIELNPTQFKLDKSSAFTITGAIDNYKKTPEFNFRLDGNFFTNELKNLFGKSFDPFIESKGIIPLKINLTGNDKKQTLKVQIASDSKNYITPINIGQIAGNPVIIQLLADFKGNRVKIKDTGIYSKYAFESFSDDMSSNLNNASKLLSIEGTISALDTKLPVMINMLKVKLHKPLDISIVGFKNSKLNLRGNVSIFGNLTSPRARGAFIIANAVIPDIALSIKRARIDFQGKEANLQTEGFIIDKSDIKFSSALDLKTLPTITLNNTKILSTYIDVDSLLSASEKAVSILPKSPVQSDEIKNTPLSVNSGAFNIKTLKYDNIRANNIKGAFRVSDNILFVNNLLLNTFKGTLSGKLSVNLLNYLMNLSLKGENMDVNEVLVTLLNLKDTLTGRLSFNTNLTLKGLDYETQVKSLNGILNFAVKNGQMGPFAKIENIFLSENLRNSDFFKGTVGSIITSAVSIDTSRFSTINGAIKFNETAIAYIEPVLVQGSSLCLKITGEMDILKNRLNAKVQGRLASMLSSALGPVANLNPVNIIKAAPGLNVVMAKSFSFFTQEISQDEMNTIPDFTKDHSDFNATKFQIILKGDINKPLRLFKSFKWLVTKDEYENAEKFVSAIPDDMPDEINTLEQLQIYNKTKENEQKKLKKKIKNIFKKEKEETIESAL